MARPKSKVTEQQAAYIDGVMTGKTKNAAAIAAGYPNATCPDTSDVVKREIALAREKLTDITQIKRVDVIDGIMDGIALARMQGDSGNVIKGWSEVAKILGHYAPEVKTVNVNMSQQRVLSKFEALSDEELTAIMNGQQAIDVESKTIN